METVAMETEPIPWRQHHGARAMEAVPWRHSYGDNAMDTETGRSFGPADKLLLPSRQVTKKQACLKKYGREDDQGRYPTLTSGLYIHIYSASTHTANN